MNRQAKTLKDALNLPKNGLRYAHVMSVGRSTVDIVPVGSSDLIHNVAVSGTMPIKNSLVLYDGYMVHTGSSGVYTTSTINVVNNTISTSGGGSGGTSTPPVLVTTMTVDGPLSVVGAVPFRYYNIFGATHTISKVLISVGTAPSGSSIIVDVHKNGTTIFTNPSDRPVIVAGANSGYTTTIDVSSWADGDYLEVQVDQYGSITPGSFLTVQIAHS